MIKDDSCRFPANSSRLLPIAAIITPAAINVVTMDKISNTQGNPPQLYFNASNYASLQNERSERGYAGPSPDTLRVAFGSAMTGQILSIAQGSPNMSYTLQFIGPALRCDPADASLISEVNKTYIEDLGPSGYQFNYMAWVPEGIDGRGNLTAISKTVTPYLDKYATDAAHIYVIPNSGDLVGPVFVGQQQMTHNRHYGYQDLLDCKLYNASYQAFFNFSFPNQAIEVQSRKFLNPVNVSDDIRTWVHYQGERNREQRISYQSIMESLGRLIVGVDKSIDGRVITVGSWKMLSIDWTTRNGTQQGLEQLFQNITLSMLSTPSLT
jgi:hypothetical protein